MLREQKIRLKNRIETCENEIELATRRVKSEIQNLKHWRSQKFAALAELHGMQLELNLRCSSCGD